MLRVAVAVLLAFAALTHAAPASAETRKRLLVLPLDAGGALAIGDARAFDARLLVALDETGRVIALTPDEEPECFTADCLAALAASAGASQVLASTLLHEGATITLFATIVDAGTALSARRTELTGLSAADVTRRAAADLARWAAGGTAGAVTLGVVLPGAGPARAAAVRLADEIAALGTVAIVTLDGGRGRAGVTHQADLGVTTFEIVKQRHHVHRYFDGVLVATLTITDLSDGRVVFTRTVKATVSRRSRHATRAEVAALLVEDAALRLEAAFQSERVEALLAPGRKP